MSAADPCVREQVKGQLVEREGVPQFLTQVLDLEELLVILGDPQSPCAGPNLPPKSQIPPSLGTKFT